ncbi:MAG: hypothetical protein HY919_02785 [Elusimicrobia bacterium]|nr:hypothetical protein [Elusimicrobiota bacterium]
MSTLEYKKHFAVALWLFLISLTVFLSFSMADPDYWGHIKFGQTIYETKSIPKTNNFSYTASGLKWINHEWLSEVIFWIFYKNFSDFGMIFLRLVVGLFFCFFLHKIVKTENLSGSAIAYLLVLFTVMPFWHFRPQIFTFLFFVILIYLLKIKKLLFIPLLFLFWANIHGGFFAGLVYFFVFAISSSEKIKLFSFFTVSAVITFLNPYGFELWAGIFRAFFNPLTRSYIIDWQPSHFFDIDFAGYWGLVSVFAYFTLIKIKKIRLAEIIPPVLFLFLSFTSIRHIPIFAVVSAPLIGNYFSDLPARIYSKAVLVIAVILTILAVYSKPKIKLEVDKNAYPVEAVEYLKKINFSGNVFCEFDWGEYILFHLYPQVKISFDGRYDTVYPIDFIKNSFEFLNLSKGVLPKNTDAVLVYSNRNISVKPVWKKNYSDGTAVLYKIR